METWKGIDDDALLKSSSFKSTVIRVHTYCHATCTVHLQRSRPSGVRIEGFEGLTRVLMAVHALYNCYRPTDYQFLSFISFSFSFPPLSFLLFCRARQFLLSSLALALSGIFPNYYSEREG